MIGPSLLAVAGAVLGQTGQSALGTVAASAATLPLMWGLVTGAVALMLLLPSTTRLARWAGLVLGLMSLGFLLGGVMGRLVPLSDQIVFWILAGVTLIAAVAAVVSPRPVYTAIWFALSVLGTAGLMFYQGAQFLSVATVTVYAGAIIVTFLFVIMLAEPEGHDIYDRITWGWYTKSVSVVVGAMLVGLLSFAFASVRSGAVSIGEKTASSNVLHSAHVARFGAELFGKHLLSIEIAGTLLLVALVGAVAIMLHGRDPSILVQGGPEDE